MSRVRPPENIEIAALRKKQAVGFDPMAAGGGTPWEDRGTHGTVGAFFKTCIMSMTAPGKMLASIRRPETTNDARGFLYGICGLWGVSALIHYAYLIHKANENPAANYDSATGLEKGALCFAAAVAGCFFFHYAYSILYGKLAATEKGSARLPEPLIYNVSAYAFGPSLLVIIPIAGPLLAVIWIFANLVVAGSSRFRLKMAAAIIDALLCFGGLLVAVSLGVYVSTLVFDHVLGFDAVEIITTAGNGAAK